MYFRDDRVNQFTKKKKEKKENNHSLMTLFKYTHLLYGGECFTGN